MRFGRLGAFGYPVGGTERERPLVACWILFMLAFLVPPVALVPLLPLLGYLVAVVDASARGDPAPRFVSDLARVFHRGVGGLVVAGGYLLLPVLALLVTVYGASTTVSGPDVTLVEGLVVYGGSTAVLGLFLAGFFLVPVGLAAYADDGSVRAAFSAATVGPVAGHAAYFTRWMTGAVALGIAGALANAALSIPRAGAIVAALVLAYGAVLAAHLWGLGVRRAREW